MTTIRLVRADTLPENINYHDDGCEVSVSCLTCPLPICKFDDPGWLQRASRQNRDEAMIHAREVERLSVAEIAGQFEVSTRTVHRVLKQDREGVRQMPDPDQRPSLSMLTLRTRSPFRAPAPLPRIWPPADRDARTRVDTPMLSRSA
ncbi:MAG: helix-turn-helix domain-containing protein [Chloroflexi bacterium]|nr:helix-turn-helix domain-containing protein [Chloroflexota bacterium]